MPGSGTRTFVEPDHYEGSLRQTLIDILVTPLGRFEARLVWAELQHLQILRCEEELARIAYLSSAPRPAFIAFPTTASPFSIWRGVPLWAGEIMLHSRGERLHQAMSGPSAWNVIAMDPAELEDYVQVLSGKPFSLPLSGRQLRPARRDAARLRRLHAQACRLAETTPRILAHPEVARAIEQGLIHALVTCLAGATVQPESAANRRHARIMIRFEELLAEHPRRPLQMSELCELIGVTDPTLRSWCAEFLSISPSRYVLLRRLKQVRVALRDADPVRTNVAEVARSCGFTELGRFVGVYQAAFGEPPSTTLQRPAEIRLAGS